MKTERIISVIAVLISGTSMLFSLGAFFYQDYVSKKVDAYNEQTEKKLQEYDKIEQYVDTMIVIKDERLIFDTIKIFK
jgi:hypothetical protein